MSTPRPPARATAPGGTLLAVPLVLAILFPGCSHVRPPAAPAIPPPSEERWLAARTPAKGSPEAIGSPSAGCLRGAASLTADGPGFRAMRISRRRFYGHPLLLDTLRDVAARLSAGAGGTLLVGDLSMARGGPMPGAHGSHQTGLDGDVWFSLAEDFGEGRPFTLDERENLPAAKFGGEGLDAPRTEMLRLFGSHPSVERLFVSPAIKRELCRRHPGPEDAPWLRKVRPWWGHEDHLHLRVACPADSAGCVPGKALPDGNGCDDTLDWWFGEEAKARGEAPPPRETPLLPEACLSVAEAPPWE